MRFICCEIMPVWLTIKYAPQSALPCLLDKLKQREAFDQWREKKPERLSFWVDDDKLSAAIDELSHWSEIKTITLDCVTTKAAELHYKDEDEGEGEIKETTSEGFEHLIGVSKAHQALITKAKKLATLSQPLLIYGETGTGKEALARACHLFSQRALQPFLVLNCAAMPDDVLEYELFGHGGSEDQKQRGIFELADGGTVFLDDLGQMSRDLQVKLIRVLQDGRFRRVGEESEIQVDVRIMAASRHSALELLASQQMREDLFYRLNVLTLTIPPLRERADDIAALCHHALVKYAEQLGIKPPRLSPELIKALASYHWVGNVRELDNSILNALTDFSGDELSLANFSNLTAIDALSGGLTPKEEASSIYFGEALLGTHLSDIMADYEKQVLAHLYQGYPSSRKLAKRLNVSHTSIANKLRQYGIG
jgi:transcriptional regulator of aroF, aroG, tyrA and aromatic amino acid transport